MIQDCSLNPYFMMVNYIDGSTQDTGISYPARYTVFHEMDIITWGNGIDVVNGKEYFVQYGDVFHRVPGMHNIHYFPYHCYFFVFDPYFNGREQLGIPRNILDGKAPIPHATWNPIQPFSFARDPYLGRLQDPEPVILRARMIYDEYKAKYPDWLLIRAEFLLLLRDIARQLDGSSQDGSVESQYSHYNQRIRRVHEAILSNPGQKWKLSDAAEIAQLSPNFFSKVFHELSGETFVEYVQRMRIKNAVVLLTNTDMSLEEISEHLGFCDVTYFQTLFKKQTGTSPGKFRKLIVRM